MRTLATLLLLLSWTVAFAQSNPPKLENKPSVSSYFKSISELFSRRWNSREELQRRANAVAVRYHDYVKEIRKQADTTIHEAESRLNELDFREKCNLALELWRVHSSLNLIALLSSDVLSQLTGLSAPDLQGLRSRLGDAERRFQKLVPGF